MRIRHFGIMSLLVVVMVLSLLVSVQAKNVDTYGFATIDYTLCVAFHPYMASYDFTKKRFFKPNVNFNDKNKIKLLQQQVVKNRANVSSKLTRLKKRKQSLQDTINKSEIKHFNTKNKMLKQQKSVEALETSYFKKLHNLNDDKKKIDEEISQITDSITSNIYYSSRESNLMMQNIFTEVDRVVKSIAKQNGNLAIIDQSYLSNPSPSMNSPVNVNGLDVTGASLYAQLLGFNFADPISSSKGPVGHAQRVTSGLNTYFKSKFEKYISQSAPLKGFISNARGKLFLTGQKDITQLVLSQILAEHRVETPMRERILRLVDEVK